MGIAVIAVYGVATQLYVSLWVLRPTVLEAEKDEAIEAEVYNRTKDLKARIGAPKAGEAEVASPPTSAAFANTLQPCLEFT